MTLTPIKYFKGNSCASEGVQQFLIFIDILTDYRLFHVNAYTCISHVFKLKIKIISDRGLLKIFK